MTTPASKPEDGAGLPHELAIVVVGVPSCIPRNPDHSPHGDPEIRRRWTACPMSCAWSGHSDEAFKPVEQARPVRAIVRVPTGPPFGRDVSHPPIPSPALPLLWRGTPNIRILPLVRGGSWLVRRGGPRGGSLRRNRSARDRAGRNPRLGEGRLSRLQGRGHGSLQRRGGRGAGLLVWRVDLFAAMKVATIRYIALTVYALALSIWSGNIIVGANENNDNGAAYIFLGATQQAQLTSPNPKPFASFGSSVSIFGPYVVVGAASDDNEELGPNSNKGLA